MGHRAKITKIGSFDNLVSWEIQPISEDAYELHLVHVVDGKALTIRRRVTSAKEHKYLISEVQRIHDVYEDVITAVSSQLV